MAEEILLMAAKLQDKERNRLSLIDLKNSAAEVDIAPEYVDRAVQILKPTLATDHSRVSFSKFGLLSFFSLLQCVVFIGMQIPENAPVVFLSIFVAATAGLITARKRRNLEFVSLSIFASVFHLCVSALAFSHEPAEDVLARGALVIVFLVATFLSFQGLRDMQPMKRWLSLRVLLPD